MFLSYFIFIGSIEKIYEANLAAKNLYDGNFNRLTVRNSYVLIRAFKKLFGMQKE